MKFSKADNPWYDVIVKNGTNISLAGGDNIDQDFMVTDAMLKSLKDAYFSQQYFKFPQQTIKALNAHSKAFQP